MLNLYTSNRLEKLIEKLAQIIKLAPPPPLQKETIIVQSLGMERWLSMELANYFTVWANGDFPFPSASIWRILSLTLGDFGQFTQYKREVIVWSLMEILPTQLHLPEFAELNYYLQDDPQGLKRYQLAWRIADLFDHYLIFRPEWIEEWEKGLQPPKLTKNPQAIWQAMLWQALINRYGNKQHQAKLRGDFFQKYQNQTLPINKLPKRLNMFGIPALPPFYWEVFAYLGQLIEINIFLLNPSQEYWGKIASNREIAHRSTHKGEPVSPETLYFETGNTLLANMGQLGRDFMEILSNEDFAFQYHEEFIDITPTHLLSHLQADILYLRNRSDNFPNNDNNWLNPEQITEKITISPEDLSIQVHVCHSPMREIEVLHDQLLSLFSKYSELKPKDILVMMPDVEKYAPYIQAVFATTSENRQKIPFTIADRSARGDSVLINTFLSILELSHSRFTTNDVLSILEIDAVQRRFHLAAHELDLIRHWVEKTGIRWGRDADTRKILDLPAYEQNTWQAGLNRMLLGYALPGEQENLFAGILPFDDIEGNDSLVLGQLLEFIEALFKLLNELQSDRLLSTWRDFLINDVLENFLLPLEDEEAQEAQQIRNVLNNLVTEADTAGFNQPVSFKVILAHLNHYLVEEPQSTTFLNGQVTFCTLLPMRSIPFKVICLIGMNDVDYPRSSRTVSFDLMVRYPKLGDRSRRDNDRYLFLEALLSARAHLYISYVGYSIQDNSEKPPSVLVSELLDYIDKGFIGEKEAILSQLVTTHPLQPFSPRYFDGHNKKLFSFSQVYSEASDQSLRERQPTQSFFVHALPPAGLEWKTLTLNQLIDFFKQPTAFLLKQRLGVRNLQQSGLLAETEPFRLSGLEKYQLNQFLLGKAIYDHDLTKLHTILEASGQLPHGNIGSYVYDKNQAEVTTFANQIKSYTEETPLVGQSFELSLADGFQLSGQLSQLWPHYLIHYRYTKLKAKDFLQVWLQHLVLNSLANPSLPTSSLLMGIEKSYQFNPIDNGLEILNELVQLYWQGLQAPLAFFPQASLAFAEAKEAGKGWKEATQIWQGSYFQEMPGEGEDFYYQLVFGNRSDVEGVLNAHKTAFSQLAKQIYAPLLKARQSLDLLS